MTTIKSNDYVGAWLKLDETSGTAAKNEVDPLNPWTSANCTLNVTGKLGTAYSFNGTTSKITAPYHIIKNADDFTVAAWINTGSSGGGSYFGRGKDGFGDGWSIRLEATTGSPVVASVVLMSGGPAGYSNTGTTTILANTWYRVVVVHVQGVGSTIYINGALDHFQSITATGLRDSTVTETIGSYSDAFFYGGTIDEVAVIDTAWSSTQVTADYNSGAGLAFVAEPYMGGFLPQYLDWGKPVNKGLQLGYDFTDGNTGIIKDKSGNGLDATIAQSGFLAEGWAGLLPNSVYLNGNAWATFPVNTYLRGLTNGTINMWFRSLGGIVLGTVTNQGGTSSNRQFSFKMLANGAVEVTIVATPSPSVTIADTPILANPSAWHMLTYTNSGSGFKLYIDGLLQSLTYSAGANGSYFFAQFMESTDSLQIGAKSDGANVHTGVAVAEIALFNVWDREFKADEVLSLYSDPLTQYYRYTIDGLKSTGGGFTSPFFGTPRFLMGVGN